MSGWIGISNNVEENIALEFEFWEPRWPCIGRQKGLSRLHLDHWRIIKKGDGHVSFGQKIPFSLRVIFLDIKEASDSREHSQKYLLHLVGLRPSFRRLSGFLCSPLPEGYYFTAILSELIVCIIKNFHSFLSRLGRVHLVIQWPSRSLPCVAPDPPCYRVSLLHVYFQRNLEPN